MEDNDQQQKQNSAKVKKKIKKLKFLVLFVGNLSYETTKEELEEHFTKTGGVIDVRIITKKESGESRGFAYVEFKDQQSLKKGLELHHSKLSGRKINVEFTAPGRGKSSKRKLVIDRKNKHWKKQSMKQTFKKDKKMKNSWR
ncbi:uncharacterized protein [Ptychodera flava]|uniref:uncharacterized protein isoform X2 n=1 Tax=Ptychodera flava TaxID=63121 RepID=UPI00396A95F4